MPEAQLNLAHAVDLPGDRAEVELGRPPRSAPRMADVRDQPAGRGPRAICGTPITLAPRSSGTARGTCTRTTSPDGWVDQQYRPDDRAERYWRPTGRGADVDRRPGARSRRRARAEDGR